MPTSLTTEQSNFMYKQLVLVSYEERKNYRKQIKKIILTVLQIIVKTPNGGGIFEHRFRLKTCARKSLLHRFYFLLFSTLF